MYNRVVTWSGVNDIDALLASIRDSSLPALRAQRGYKGLSVSADRSTGLVGTLSQWESEADRDASDSALAKLREDAAGQFAADMKIDTFEDIVIEMDRPPEVGSRLMVTRISMDPGKIDAIVGSFQERSAAADQGCSRLPEPCAT